MPKNHEDKIFYSKYDRRELFREINNIYDSNASAEKEMYRREERARKVGIEPGNIITTGSTDRINAILYDENKYKKVTDKNAYYEGFFVHGNQELSGKIELLTKDELYKIGKNDYFSGVNFKTLPPKVQNNEHYLLGYIQIALEQRVGRIR